MKPTDQITADTDFARLFTAGGKPPADWAIGVEVEVLGFTQATLERLAPAQVEEVIAGFAKETQQSVRENGVTIEAAVRGGKITIEPGGQIEFSSDVATSLADIEGILEDYFAHLREIGERLGFLFLASGFDPLRGIEEQHWFPKQRYDVMRPYLGRRGRRAWDMMCRTAAIQVNLDYSDSDDLMRKFTLANRLAPIAAAMFANSPFERGRLSSYQSTRYAAWLETDEERTGATPCALNDEFSIERFINYVRRVPMFFIRRGGSYVDLAGYDFDRFLAAGFNGYAPILQDFTDQLSTIFTEARLKPHIEQRSMDCGGLDFVLAAAAFWKGLLYDREALGEALAIAPHLNVEMYHNLQLEVARHGLAARLGEISALDTARVALRLARQGLQSLAPPEVKYLDVLEEYVMRRGLSPAQLLRQRFRSHWNGDIRKAMEYLKI